MYAFYKKYEYPLTALFVLITQLIVLPEISPLYPDTDNYTHARRVLDLIQSKNWAEIPYMHTNYPFGEILHFTRITDIFWLLFSLPAFLFFPLKEAVYWGGYIYQVGILVLSALALVWALKPVASPFLRLIGLCLFFIQPSVSETYILIKPDHHVVTALFAFILIGGLLHYLEKREIKYLHIAGISAGLCLWTSVEGLLISYALLTGLILLFLMNKESVKTCTVYYFYYFISALVCLIINPPYEGFFFPDNGRLSFLLVLVIGLTTAAMAILEKAEAKQRLSNFWRKSAVLLLLTVFFIALLLIIYPLPIVLKPYFPSHIREIWADNVVELQSGLKNKVIFFLGTWPSLFSALIALIIFKFCNAYQRSVLILTFIPLAFLTGLTIESVRFSRLSSLFVPFPLVLAFALRLKRFGLSERKQGWIILVLYVCFAAYLGINYISVNRSLLHSRRPSMASLKPYMPNGEGSVLSTTFLGPEIVWTLEEKAIGSPYHRNIEGIWDGFWILYDRDYRQALRLMKKHRVKAILLHLKISTRPSIFYNMNMRSSLLGIPKNADFLYRRLVLESDLPCGITQNRNVPPPYLLYYVDFSKCSDSAAEEEQKPPLFIRK